MVKGFPDRRTLNIALLVCGAGALWLLLSPSAFERRARMRLAEKLRGGFQTEWAYNVALSRYRRALEGNPAVIEREARKLGYGRPGERVYHLSESELRAQEARLARKDRPEADGGFSKGIMRGVTPAILLILAGVAAGFFFADLRIDDPAESNGPARTPGQPLQES